MRDFKEFKTEIGGKEVTVEIGKYAFQTNGHCIVKCGEETEIFSYCGTQELVAKLCVPEKSSFAHMYR